MDGQVTRRQLITGAAGLAAGAALPWGPVAHAAPRPVVGVSPARLPATAVTAWTAATYELVLKENLSPPAAARVYAHAAIAMYEAVVAGMPRHRSLGGQLNGLGALPGAPRGTVDWPVALTTTVGLVLEAVLPFASPETRPLLDATVADQLASRRAAGVPERVLAASAAHGRAVARTLVRWAGSDGHAGTVGTPYVPPYGSPHLWESTPPNYRPAIEPHWSQVRPMVLRTADEVVPEPHVPFSTDRRSAFYAEAMTTYRQSLVNTDEHRAIARFWTDNPGSSTPPSGTPTGLPSGHWMLIGSQAARLQGARLDSAVEVLARLGIALHEAFLNCWTWKYRLNLLRPVTYIQRYVPGAATWSSFVNTPQFPEHTSGHSVASPAAARILTDHFGAFAFVDDSHAARGMAARSFTSFAHAAQEAAQSRLYGGIHFPTAIRAGLVQGEQVGALVASRVRTRR